MQITTDGTARTMPRSLALVTKTVIAAGAMLSLGCSADAQTSPEPAAAPTAEAVATESPVDRWVRELRQIDGHLKRSDWPTAGSGTEALLVDMTDTIQGGNRAAPLMAMGTLFRSIAAAGLEREDDAMWDWYAAQTLHAGYADVDLAAYGRAGAWLLERSQADTAAAGRVVDLSQPEMADPAIKAPVRRPGGPDPVYPVALRQGCIQGIVKARILVDTEGVPRQPRIVEAPGGPPMALAALEAMRLWQFEPARLGSQPVPVFLPIEIPFVLNGCTPAASP